MRILPHPSSVSAGILFRIMKKDSVTQKQVTMAADEFAENLKVVLGKKESRGEVSMKTFYWHYGIINSLRNDIVYIYLLLLLVHDVP